jgi:hypothetical protein
MCAWHVLFVPWPRALGDSLDEHTALAADVQIISNRKPAAGGPGARMKHPDRPHTTAGMEYEYKNRQWLAATAAKGKDYLEVWYTGSMSIALSSLDASAVVYVRGHSLPGSPTIFTKVGGDTSHLTASEVGDRLIASGLRESFAGDIKCYNCHSADSGTEGGDAFAQRLADYLFDKGFVTCRYWGYLGSMSSFPEAVAGRAGVHKDSKADGRPNWRAQVARRRITPRGLTAAEHALARFR